MALSEQMLLTRTGLPTASDYQIAIFRHVETAIDAYTSRKPVTNAVVQAVAGSGKTTTIVAAANLLPTKLNAVFLAFNRDIALELKSRLPRNVEAKTLNALGWGILRKYAQGVNGGVQPEIDGSKVWGIIRKLGRENKATGQFLRTHGKDVKFLVDMAKAHGIVPAELEGNGFESANGLRDEAATWDGILSHYGKFIAPDIRPTLYRMMREVLTRSLQDETVFDFDDQKYVPVVRRTEDGNRIPCFKFDVVIIDEVQDVSPVDRALVEMVAKKGAIVMGVGDSRQAIYGFRGADTESIAKFSEAFNAVELPLSISYRCARAIIEHARNVYPVIEAAPTASQGSVDTLDEYDTSVFTPGDMVLCRNNAPLISFAYKLIRARVPVFVKGRDIGKGLITLIESLKARDVRDLSIQLSAWEEQQRSIIIQDNPDNEDGIQKITDRADTLRVFISENVDNNVQSVIASIEDLFKTNGRDADDAKDMRGKVVLSTMHKSKGLEAEKVFILDNHLMYGRWIKPGTWQMVQETNLEYVAITRAKETLVYIETDNLKD